MRYTSTAENLVKRFINPEEKEYDNIEQHIKDIISKEIAEHKSNLVQVKSYVEEKFQKPLSTIDNAYIERKYIKCCTRFWLQETTNLLKELSESKSRTVIQEIFYSLDDIKGLSQIINPLNQLEYYTLLMEHYELVSKEDEKASLSRFKKECLEQIVSYSSSAENELVFIETFVDFLSSSKNLQSIIAELKLENFVRDDLLFDELISNIMKLEVDTYGENLTVLQEAADGVKKEKYIFLIHKFKEVIGAYVKPTKIQERRIDDRLVVELAGKNVVVSEILQQLENKLSENPDIEEVRFVGADIIHIDADFKNEVWYGKNVVILTKTIKIPDKVIWDVSGKDNDHIYSDKAGTGEDGHGKRGKDGYPGKSGGNVLILVEKIENPENFTIISNGGKGSKGQDGGNGRDGKDGVGITKTDFDKKFPAVADFGSGNIRRVCTMKDVVGNIKDDSLTVNTVWYTGANNATIEKIIKDLENIISYNKAVDESTANTAIIVFRLFDENIFIEAVTNQRNEITFSFERGGGLTSRQAFFLYKGSLGEPGGHGGEWGLGGQGGYAGEIIAKNLEKSGQEFGIMKNIKQGEEGEIGKGGLYGSHGKNGWDMGYLDHKWWNKAKFRDQGKYKVEYYDLDNNPSDRVWCPYKKRYAGIVAANIEQKKQSRYEERKNTRQNNDRQHHAQAVRKKNISQSSILANYSQHLSSMEKNTLQDLRSDLENTKQRALQAITENQEQQEKQTMELGIKRHVSSVHQGKNNLREDTIPNTTYKDTTDVDGLIDKLKSKPQLLDNWLQLKGIELNSCELDELFSNFEIVKKNFLEKQNSQNNAENSKLQCIEKLLIDKYRLATLQKIAKQLPHYQEVADNIELTPESAARYLVEKEKGNNIYHPTLETLNQYLYENGKEQRQKISKFCKEDTNNEALKYFKREFVLEVGKSEEVHSCIKQYYDEHKEFLEKQKQSLNILFEEFKSELSKPGHAEVFDLWIKSIEDKSLSTKLEEEIQKDGSLKALYNSFNSQLKQEYDWNECCKNQDVLKEYDNYIQGKGLLSESYRELLACIFDINIRLYVEDQDNKLSLQDNHNPSSKNAIHVLYTANEFIELNIDENYLRLEEERKKKDELYAKIFTEIEPLKQKQEFDDYLEKKTFSSGSNLSEDEILNQSFYDKYCFSEEQNAIEITKYFSTEKEKQQLKERLEKITSRCIGQQDILHNIQKRFSSEGRYVSFQELSCLVNSILTSVVEDKKEFNTFCWIVAAHSQRNWIDELILLQFENYFKEPLAEKSKWRAYLSKIENKDILLLFNTKLDQCKPGSSISTQCIEEILYLLSDIPNEIVSLEGLELSEWPYALKEKYWTCRLSKLVDWQKSDLPVASYYLLSTENTFGTDLVKKFLEALEGKRKELSPDALTNILSNFHNEKWNLSKDELDILNSCSIDKWVQKMLQKFTANKGERKITQLVKLIKVNANTSKEISDNLSKISDYIQSVSEKGRIINGKSVDSFTTEDIKEWAKAFKSNISEGRQSIEETRKEMLAVIDRAIELRRGFNLRDTQKLTVLALLTNDHNTLAQVSTGEGKSLIVVAASIMKGLCGEKVDIITSSSVLAKRDAEGNKDIYSLFNINVSHNCSEDIEKRKEAYSGNQVVYGDLCNFQRDYLLDKFYGKNVLGDRNFNSVVVDEVDSMLLDKGNNMLYLSHDLADLDKLECIYIYIWQWINRPARDHEEISYAFDIKAIKEAVINDLYGLIKKEDVGKLGSELNEQQKNIVWERLIKAEILDDRGKLLKGSINDNELDEILCKILSPEFSSYKDSLNYLLKECIGRERFIHVPNYLKPFIEQHLQSWINSAITAFFMKAGQDYVVDVDRTGTSPDRNPNITILDRDTGADQANSQWDESLHQFLQLKHGCKLSLQSLKAVFISNVSFFKLYNNLYGLTGTLGSQRERDLLREIHKIEFVTIPTAKSKQFHEDKPTLCTGKKEWINHIHNEVKKLTEEKKRSVLIICETVNDVEVLNKAFGGKDAKHVHTYIRDYEKFDIAQGNKVLEQGQIIIATNLAGRGTDIKITEGLRKAGGLYVCLTYLPSNIRIEQQAFGRAARSGDKGSGKLIIMDTKGREYSNSKILDLKKERDAEELRRISDIKVYYKTQIIMEESCFKKFKELYEKLKKVLDDKNVPTEVKEIILQSCLDKWAFWLDKHNKCIRNFTDEQGKRSVDSLLNEFSQLKNFGTGYSKKRIPSYDGPPTLFIENDSKSWLAWVEGNPVQMVKLGRYLSKNEENENAIVLFDDVIEKEPYFSEAARYYKAFALAKKIDWEQKPLKEEDKKVLKEFKQELREAAKLLNEHSKFATNSAGIIGKIKKNNNESIIQIDAYEEQKKNVANLYYMFSRSIDDIFGHLVTPQSFVNSDIKEELANVLYEDLLRKDVLKMSRVKKSIYEEELKTISSDYGVSAEILQDFLSKHEGRKINEKEFQKELKKAVPLPSREAFWKLLIQEEVLSEEIKYVVVDNERLREIDPSLLDFLTEKVCQKELKEQILHPGNEEIFFNAERIGQQQNNDNFILKKDDFKLIVKGKYQIIKKKGVLSFNMKAHIDKGKIGSVSLPHYDSITLEDFTKVNITKHEAEKVLAELVKQKVVEKKNGSENNAYGLIIKFDEIRQIQLPVCRVYENVVKGLLSVCFTYRIALQEITGQLEEKNFLICKPHRSLVLELLEQKIIKPVTATTEDEDLEEKLKSIYSGTMTKDNFKLMLSQDELIPKECIEKLFNCLIEKKWIFKYDTIRSIKEKGIRGISKENIKNASKSLIQDRYCINSPDKRRIPLNFSSEGNQKNVLTKSQSIDKTVGKVLDFRLQLAKEDTIKNIVNTLKRSRSSLKVLKALDSKLKPLTEFCEFANIDEARVFFLNGLDQLLQLEEKKWTREMLRNTAVVTAMGISQIAVGTAIELYSAGIMTHLGTAIINEGVNDLFFAVGSLKTGYFSWEDYMQHKLESLMMSAVTVGIGAYLSSGAKVSRFGRKLAESSFEIGGKKVAEMSGTQLIKTAGFEVVGKEVTKRIALKAAEGIAFGLANAGVDTIVENYLQGLCEGIASSILSNIEQKVEKHNISESLKKIYEILGEIKAKKIVNDLTQSAFTEQNCLEKFFPIANKIVSSVTQGISKAVEKRSATSNKLVFPIHIISKVVVWLERAAHIGHITMITGKHLDDLDRKIKNKSNSNEFKKNALDQKQEVEKNYEIFKKELIDQWKSLLRERAGKIIERHIVNPILKEGTNRLVKYVGRQVGKAYRSYKESQYLEQFEELKREYKKKLQSQQQCDNTSKIKNHITEKYHKELRKLMVKTRNPGLLADLVRENIPMDMTCVSACTQVVHKILKERGVEISGLTIIVEGDNGIRQKCSSAPDGVEGTIIKLTLQDNHFQLCGSGASVSNTDGNNCLYEALGEAIPQIRDVAPEKFRAGIANCIELDPKIRYSIHQGWHQLPISLGAFGGYISVPTNKLNEQAERQSPYQHVCRGGWNFDESKDVDLREVKPLSNKELHSQRANAFNEALNKINQKLSNIGKLRTPVDPGNFEATKHDLVLCTGKFGKIDLALYPVEMRTTVKVWVQDVRKHVEYTLKIDVDNPIIKSDLQGPHGPHIGYKVSRHGKEGPEGVTGHMLINTNTELPDRGRSSNAYAFNIARVPVRRLFFSPTRPNTYLERIKTTNESQDKIEIKPEFKNEIRDRKYPSPNY